VRAEAKRVVFLLLHLDPVGHKVGVEDVALRRKPWSSLKALIAPLRESGTLKRGAS
jgi:hypothetical protein